MSDTLIDHTSSAADIDAVQTEAKKTFSLKARLSGLKTRTVKVLVFTDPETVEKVASLQAIVNINKAKAEALVDSPENKTAIAQAKKLLKDAEKQLEPLKEDMLRSALSVHLVALPDVAMQTARRLGRKAALQEDGTRDENVQQEVFNMELLKRSVFKVVDSTGAEAEDASAEDLHEFLPFTQWERIQGEFNRLQFTDSVAQAATDDAGF